MGGGAGANRYSVLFLDSPCVISSLGRGDGFYSYHFSLQLLTTYMIVEL